jgi:hypothetical protein
VTYEDEARQRKVITFADHLHNRGVSAEQLQGMHTEDVEHLSREAGLAHPPSGHTMNKVLHQLQFLSKLNKADDPFEGL